MAQAVARPWREAATLILTARCVSLPSTIHTTIHTTRQPTLEAATFDYRVLMLQRSSRSKFMPNAFVFPGGVVDQGDMAEVGGRGWDSWWVWWVWWRWWPLPQAWLSLYRDLGQGDSLASLDIQDRCILAHVAAGGTFSHLTREWSQGDMLPPDRGPW